MAIIPSLPFEKPVVELEERLRELKEFSEAHSIDVSTELADLTKKIRETQQHIFSNLTAWDKVQLARHPQRPYTLDYIEKMCADFVELHGDRAFKDDLAIVGGFARLGDEKIMIIGTQKGRDVKSNIARNFGMAHPEGYRKALRMMKLAAKFQRPIVTLIDTAGAYPGIGSEERHIAEAIAVNLREAFLLPVPIIIVVIGEGGSGGALGIGIGDRVLILEHAYYSVISPEGCAAILWKDRTYASKAAEALKMTAKHLLKAELVDEIIPEPLGGAHRDPDGMAAGLKKCLLKHLQELRPCPADKLLQNRYDKFRKMGIFTTEEQNHKPAEQKSASKEQPNTPEEKNHKEKT